VAAFPVGGFFGLERSLAGLWSRARRPPTASTLPVGVPPPASSRPRADRAAASLPVLGGFVLAVLGKRRFDSYEEKLLRATGTWTP